MLKKEKEENLLLPLKETNVTEPGDLRDRCEAVNKITVKEHLNSDSESVRSVPMEYY